MRQCRSYCGVLSQYPVFSSLPCACFLPVHEGWVRLFWNRAQVKIPGTLSTAQKGTKGTKLEVDSDLGQARIYLGLEESLGIIQLNI